MENYSKFYGLSGVILVILALISDNVVQTDVNFKSNPTTVKSYENDSVLLPCYSKGSKNNVIKFSRISPFINSNWCKFRIIILQRIMIDKKKIKN